MDTNESDCMMPVQKAEQIEKAARKRGRAYQCLRCLHRDGKVVIEVKRRIEAHIIRDHLRRDEVPFYCALCQFRCQREEDLQEHVTKFRRHSLIAGETGVNPTDSSFLRTNPKPYLISERDYHQMDKEESFSHWKAVLCRKFPAEDPLGRAFNDAFPGGDEELRSFLQESATSTPASYRDDISEPGTENVQNLRPEGPRALDHQQERGDVDPQPGPSAPREVLNTHVSYDRQLTPTNQVSQPGPKAQNPQTAIVSLSREGINEAVAPILASLTALLGPARLANIMETGATNDIAGEKQTAGTRVSKDQVEPENQLDQAEEKGMDGADEKATEGQQKEDEVVKKRMAHQERPVDGEAKPTDEVENLMPQLLPTERRSLSPMTTPKRPSAGGYAPTKRMQHADSSDSESEDERKMDRDLREALERNTQALRSMEKSMLTLASAMTSLAKQLKGAEGARERQEEPESQRRGEVREDRQERREVDRETRRGGGNEERRGKDREDEQRVCVEERRVDREDRRDPDRVKGRNKDHRRVEHKEDRQRAGAERRIDGEDRRDADRVEGRDKEDGRGQHRDERRSDREERRGSRERDERRGASGRSRDDRGWESTKRKKSASREDRGDWRRGGERTGSDVRRVRTSQDNRQDDRRER